MKKSLLFVFVLLLTSYSLVAQSITFQQAANANLTGSLAGTLNLADVDSDGDLDLFVTGYDPSFQNSQAVLYTNDGTGSYTPVTGTNFPGVNNGDSAFSDIDGDNDLDLLLTGRDGQTYYSKLYKNDGTGNFTEVANTSFNECYSCSIAFGDIDVDGDEDLLMMGRLANGNNYTNLYSNDGTGNFTLENASFPELEAGNADFADVDSDGDLDLLLMGKNNFSGTAYTELHVNDGMGNFTELTSTTFPPFSRGHFEFGDVNGDQNIDVIITGENGNTGSPEVHLYLNDGAGGYTASTTNSFTGLQGGVVRFSDLDTDGDLDIFVSGQDTGFNYRAHIYTNDGNGNFTQISNSGLNTLSSGSAVFGDVNNDSKPDLIYSGDTGTGSGPVTELYVNQTTLSTYEHSNNKIPVALYPNPSRTGTFNLNLQENSLNALQVYDLTGKIVYDEKELENRRFNLNLQKGLYTVKLVMGNNKLEFLKLVVK